MRRKSKELAPEQFFYSSDGKILKNVRDLVRALKKIDKDSFNHHVSDERNDFSNWINDIIRDRKLAERIRDVRNPKEMAKIIDDNQNEKKKISEKISKAPVINPVRESRENMLSTIKEEFR